MPNRYETSPGEPHPLGATSTKTGVNFSVFSANATAVELLLFERFDDSEPFQIIRLDSRHNRTFSYWHVFVRGATEGVIYAFRAAGPFDAFRGMRFNPHKVLLDPYAKGIVYGSNWSHADACAPEPNIESSMKSLVVDVGHFDWQGIEPPRVDPSERVIYEMHVRGFTKHESAGAEHPGSFAGIIEKIPYLRELGVTTIELLPVFQFDEREIPFVDPETGEPLTNYWGYNPLGFFAPHRGFYIEDWERMRYLTGFRDLVRELHRHGMELFLDVVFNHTAEGDEKGPTLSFRGLDNNIYYLLDPNDRGRYLDYSGTGNTVNCNHPVVRRLILDSLRYWAEVMHVDGFRFDLAAVMSRDELGRPMDNPPLPWEIESDPVLQRTKLIAEAWDAAGLYQVGRFPGERWAEWNGLFRDDVRRFVRGDLGMAGSLASRMLGSPDLYEKRGRDVTQCINFVTCHDGFTLYDLVTYAQKHNAANGEDNRDGTDQNWSDNHGVEGPSDDPAIETLRRRQMKNFLAILFLSQGTPMLLGGDEMGRTQRGNNNAYCQDNEISWFDWHRRDRFEDVHRFTREVIRFRKAHPSLRRRRYLLGHEAPITADTRGYTRVRWHGVEPDRPDWSGSSRTLSFTLTESEDDVAIHVIISAHTEALSFVLPPPPAHRRWVRAIDTSRAAPEDICDPGREARIPSGKYLVQGRSVVVLVSA